MENNETKKEDGVPSPFVPPATFDYDKYQDETTVKATIKMFQCFGKNAELLAYTHDTKNDVIVANMSKVAQEMMDIIVDCKVPNPDMEKLADMLSQIPFQLFQIIKKQIGISETELLARYIGVRDPGTNTYSREFGSAGDMFAALIKLRHDQGDKAEDYLIVKKENK